MQLEPRATYRIQFRPDFGFDHAIQIIPYLVNLGISDLYSSPYLQAALGSTHGYDVVNPTRVNDELGGEEAHARLCESLKEAGLSQIIDVVPNHMAIAGKQNPWWWDVLENGPSSRYATYFDVDWEASEERWLNKVLLPVLGDHYGRILEDGQFKLSHKEGVFTLHYYEHIFPIDPSSLVDLLSRAAVLCQSELLEFLAESHSRLPRPTVTARHAVERRHRDKAVLLSLLARLCQEDPKANQAINEVVAQFNADANTMDILLDQQNYRLSFWRTASRELGYRRFFDINNLAGLRIEDLEVFNTSHALPITWVQKGWVQGLRIDHPDGLLEPVEYFYRLQEACPKAWIVIEKILEPGEQLRQEWPIAGTTGYDFLNLVGGLLIHPDGEKPLTRIYDDFIGEPTDFKSSVEESKRLVLKELLGSEINRLTSLFVDICELHRRHRDYTRYELQEALCETAICFPVYRTYLSESSKTVSKIDEDYITQAIQTAMEKRKDLDDNLFLFLKELLLLRIDGSLETKLALRFQQLTGPAMAKGVEDTALYRYNRLLALNEVGGNPNQFGNSISQFHQACAFTQKKHPQTLLATTTHDTKRSEDVRVRLALLSEIPERWAAEVHRWAQHNEPYHSNHIPDRNTEYLLYQTLVGAWPITTERILAYMEKAIREAKVFTSWRKQNEEYESGLRNFIQAIMEDKAFINDLENFVSALINPGRINSLTQTLLKLTTPGIPDIYQGTELWNLSLVDPDNRRLVDFAARQQLLDELEELSIEEILQRSEEGLPKLWLIKQTLHLRAQYPKCFGPQGSYKPLFAHGAKSEHVVSFMRGETIIPVTQRFSMKLNGEWGNTKLEFPAGFWHNILTNETMKGGPVLLKKILAHFPVALFLRRDA